MQHTAGDISDVSILHGLGVMTTKALLGAIWCYQHSISVMIGPRCRFYPSCSSYACECLKKYPLGKALKKTSHRLLKCHPFHPGGIDLP